MEQTTLTHEQRARSAKLPKDYRMIGVDRSSPMVHEPTGQITRVQQNGRLTAASVAAKRRLAERGADSVVRLRRLEGTAQAALATLRRSLIEEVQPTRDGLAHEAAIAFDLTDDRRALAIIDEVAQTVGISALF